MKRWNAHDMKWHHDRQTGIGASESRDLMGLGYTGRNAAKLYEEKVSPEPIIREPDERMRLGLVLEPEVALRYEEETGYPLAVPVERITRHPQRRFQFASLDRLTVHGRPCELKCVFDYPGEEWGASGTDHVPEGVIIQAVKQAGIVGADCCEVAALFVGHCFRRYSIPFDARLWDLITAADQAFWDHVERRIPVAADWTCAAGEEAAELVARIDQRKILELGDDAQRLADEYRECRKIGEDAEDQARRVKGLLVCAMGDAGTARLPDGSKLRRFPIAGCTYTTTRQPSMGFRIFPPSRKRATA